jgi:hypothetical protein
MKLQELAAPRPTKQVAKVFESYFGNSIQFDNISHGQAQTMLQRVRALVREHRRTSEFHHSEHNPSYLKLVMMEQVLSARIMEVAPPTGGVPPVAGATATGAVTSAPVNPADAAKQQALMAAQQVQKKKEIQDQIKMKQQEIIELQKQMNMPMAETRQSLRRRLRESEVQQAQVVLASQDMVDQVQKMSEQISAMQFKDLPALVDQIKNEVGVDQAMQFNTDSTAALAGLLQNLQVAKQQLEQALGVVTGQAAVVPGEDLGGELPPAELGGEELPPELPAPDEDVNPAGSSLGRGRR